MGGGLMQLVAYGAQDIYLTGNPQITFFKVVYRRHTNFSMEAIQQTLNGSVAASGRSTVTISRNGDLVGRVFVEHTGHSTVTLNESATQLDSVELEIGGQRIDKIYGHWMQVYAELVENKTGAGRGSLFQTMSGLGAGVLSRTAMAATDGAAGTGSSHSAVDMDSRVVYTPLPFFFCRNPGLALPLIALQYHEVKLIFNWGSTMNTTDHTVWADYFYLDTDERRRFAQVSHEYLIEQLQFINSSAGTSHELNFNHPVKEIVWTGGWSSGAVVALNALGDTAKLVLNGHDRMAARKMTYFTQAQVWAHHSGQGGFVDNSIAVYSFAIKPEEHQPSGTCNFSRIDNARLELSASDALYIYAVNYNVLRVMSGMGGLAYSN
tara:strand:+ start:1674 stop:2807 length:1134 start_codon:yes stop_codon:yes gene_type:complete